MGPHYFSQGFPKLWSTCLLTSRICGKKTEKILEDIILECCLTPSMIFLTIIAISVSFSCAI